MARKSWWIAALPALALMGAPLRSGSQEAPGRQGAGSEAPADADPGPLMPPRSSIARGPQSSQASAEAAELGRTASLAELCGLDDPALIARQTGIQLAAGLWASPAPSRMLADLDAFGRAYASGKASYLAMDQAGRARECSFGWLQWRSMRSASHLGSAGDFAKALKLTGDAGSVHGWAWACQVGGEGMSARAEQIAQQSASALVFAAIASKSPSDLARAQAAWSQSFQTAYFDSTLTVADCSDLASALPLLSTRFESKTQLAPQLAAAHSARMRLAGDPS